MSSRKKAPIASPLKHVVYLVAATFLGLLLSLILHAGIEMLFLRILIREGLTVRWFGGCALPFEVQYFLLFGGVIIGFMTGRYWWRKMYIEKVWCQEKK